MPRKTARKGVPINKFVMNEMGGTNPKPSPIKKKRTPTNKRFHYEEIDKFGGSASFPAEYWGNDANTVFVEPSSLTTAARLAFKDGWAVS
jgi:hypothetical protein